MVFEFSFTFSKCHFSFISDNKMFLLYRIYFLMSLLNIIVPFVPDCNNSLATVGTKVRDMQERRKKRRNFLITESRMLYSHKPWNVI